MAKYEGEVLNEKPGEVSGAVTPPVDFEAQYKDKAEKLKADYDKKVKDLTTTTLKVGGDTYEIPSVLTSTPVVAAATVAGLYGAKKVGEYALDKASSALEGIKNRMINKNHNVVDVQSRTIVPEDIPEEWRGLYEKSQQNAASKAADAAARANPVPQNYTPGVPTVQPNAPVNPAGAFTQPSGYGATTSNIPSQLGQPNIGGGPIVPTAEVGPVAPTPSVQAGVESGNPAKAIQSVIAKEIDKSAGMYRNAEGKMVYPESMSPAARAGYESFTQQYPDIAKTLEAKGQFGILGGGSGDNSLKNTYDIELAKKIRNEVLSGKMVGPHGGEGGFYNTTGTPAIKAIPPTTALGKEIAALPEKGGTHGDLGTPATIGGAKGGLLTGKNTVLKGLKAGGPAILLMAMADAAKAAESKESMSRASKAIKDIGIAPESILGGKGDELGRMGNAYVTAGNPNYLRELKAQLDVETNPERRNVLLREFQKIGGSGAGRGIAPPSAYLR